jgi:hypothetical protein
MLRLLSLLTVWLNVGVVLAQAPIDPGNVSRYDFEDELVDGGRRNPDGEVLHARPRPEHTSLIRVREHFIHELLHSVQQL